MKIKIYFFILILNSITIITMYPLSHDLAIHYAQKGDIAAAHEHMRKMVVDSPDNPVVLHDAGILAYKQNDFNQAITYFTRAAQYTNQDKKICFSSYFNAGNISVENKDLKKALEYYDEALKIEPDNENARHNRELVEKMLREQEKQQEQQKNNEQNNQDQEKDQQENENKNNQQKEQQSNDGTSPQKDNKQDQSNQNQNAHSSENQSDQKSQRDQRKNTDQKSDGEQGEQKGNNEKHQQNGSHNEKRDGKQKLEEKPEKKQNQGKKQESKKHTNSPEKQNKKNDNNSITSDNIQEQGKETNASESLNGQAESKIDDPWLMSILNDQETQDKAINKKLIEARIHQCNGGKNDQNCW